VGSIVNMHSQVAPRKCLLAVGLTLVSGAMLAVSPSAFAVNHPTGEFVPFADCPLADSAVEQCILAKTESGEFIVGKERVPISNTITLQGGVKEVAGSEVFVAAEDGNTLSKTAQKVPGGLAGLVKCNEISNFLERVACEVVFENGLTGVNATTELAAPASAIGISITNLVESRGTALSLPVKVHLENPFLGSACYIGSNAHPIVIALTTGTTSPPPPNTPISGSAGEFEFNPEGSIVTLKKNKLVNNSFAAPGVEGCGGLFAFLINPIVNGKLGLPSAAGHNTAVLGGTLKEAIAESVRGSE
jgi:hypothetical protein